MNNNYDFPVQLQPIFLSDQRVIPNRKAVVRTDSMDTLGIVSDDYALLEHTTVVNMLKSIGEKYHTKEKIFVTNNGGQLFYEMLFPKIQIEVQKNDLIQLRMIVKNSYNSMNSLQMIFGAFRLVCLNGMVIGTKLLSYHYRHMGAIRELEMDQIGDNFAQYIKLFNEQRPMIQAMIKQPIMLSDSLFEEKQIQLPHYLLAEAKQSYETERDWTAWGYYNSLTHAITHKMKKESPAASIKYGIEAWKAAERVMN